MATHEQWRVVLSHGQSSQFYYYLSIQQISNPAPVPVWAEFGPAQPLLVQPLYLCFTNCLSVLKAMHFYYSNPFTCSISSETPFKKFQQICSVVGQTREKLFLDILIQKYHGNKLYTIWIVQEALYIQAVTEWFWPFYQKFYRTYPRNKWQQTNQYLPRYSIFWPWFFYLILDPIFGTRIF